MIAVKHFEIDEHSEAGTMWWIIVVRHSGKYIEEFRKPTMKEAREEFARAGYKFPAVPLKDLSRTSPRI